MHLFRFFVLSFAILIALLTISAEKRVRLNVTRTELVPAHQENWAEEQLKLLTLEEKIAQFFMIAAYSGKGEEHYREIEELIRTQKVGGIIFFQGDRNNFKTALKRFEAASSLPLLVGMDAEWGVQMRLSAEERFPYPYTLGAANDLENSEKIAAMMAQECRELGIHLNFAPVADVNSDPTNPVIGFRSFGENPKLVADHVRAFVRGFEANGIMSTVKHFPGHGNTNKDSHLELPTVDQSLKTLEAIDLFPFSEAFREGSSSVMIGHLNVPALDPSGTPATLSKLIIKDYLQKQMGFKGLVISDALNMKAVADKYGKTEVVVKAFEAGCDILLFPESVEEAINAIKKSVLKGDISEKELNERCLKVLKAKQKFVLQTKSFKTYTVGEQQWARRKSYESALTVLKNNEATLPLSDLSRKIESISIGENHTSLKKSIGDFADVDHYSFANPSDAKSFFATKRASDVILINLHASTVRARDGYGFGEGWQEILTLIPSEKTVVLNLFGNPQALKGVDLSAVDAVVVAYENHPLVQERAAQLLFGAAPSIGKLPMTIQKTFERGSGIELAWGGRLKFSQPEEFGIDPKKFEEVDKMALNGIAKGAYPGCQIVVAYKGSLIYRKNFGTKTFSSKDSIQSTDVYDIASITKIAASTVGLMYLQSNDQFSLNAQLKEYIDVSDSRYAAIRLRDMMAHQAGLTAWIPFYKRTLEGGKPASSYYSAVQTDDFSIQVAHDLWIRKDYSDSMYQQIMRTPLSAKTYVYSDLGYYFVKKIIEKQSGKGLDKFLHDELYGPMGLRSLRYNPLDFMNQQRIVPTENDQAFRKQLIHGYVHDPGAAMLGGVGGHAGLFANATDLASLMQLFMNKGMYGAKNYLKEQVVEEYTKAQFPGNRRGAGFDRPTASGGGTCHSSASQKSYGHSGFTGTLAWVDPEHAINYVFLSNRVCPDQENWKLRDMHIRTEIQRVIYEILLKAK
jgi:beta-N-acetylhexosaminidase